MKSKIILESIHVPEPVIQLMVEPKSKADQDKMGIALSKLAEEDPTFRVETNVETGETVISGMGELHLDVLVDRMRREFKVEANVGAPQVSYRETFRASTQARGFFKRQSGGKGQFGDVWINSHQTKKVKVSSSRTLSSVVWFHVNSSQRLKRSRRIYG